MAEARQVHDIESEALTMISALCTVSRDELLAALPLHLPPSALAIVFAIAASRICEWLDENFYQYDSKELIWIVEGLAGFYKGLAGDELKAGREYFIMVLQKVDAAICEIASANMNPLDAIKHIRNSLGDPAGRVFDDERIGPFLLKSSLKVWWSAPEGCRTAFVV